MPHEAITVNDVTESTCVIKVGHSYLPNGYHRVYPVADVGTISFRKEPASRLNPIRADGTRAPSDYFIKRLTVSNPPGRALQDRWDPPYQYYQEGGTSPRLGNWLSLHPETILQSWVFGSRWTNVDSGARTRFLNKLADKAGRNQVELGVIAGEFRETAGMAADLASGLASGAVKLARNVNLPSQTMIRALRVAESEGMKAAAKQLLHSDVRLMERIVEAWLVVQFGLKPLASDVIAASSELGAKLSEGADLTCTIRAGRTDVFQDSIQLHNQAHQGAFSGTRGYFLFDIGVHYSCVYKVPTKVPATRRWGLEGTLPILYELARFTWMFDYVTDVGPWLNSHLAAAGTTFVEGTRSIIQRADLVRMESTGIGNAYAPFPWLTDPADAPCNISAVDFKREVLPHGVFPALLPSFKNRLNAVRLANSLAALTTVMGSREKPLRPII